MCGAKIADTRKNRAAGAVTQQTFQGTVWLLTLALLPAFGQNARPDFTGVWRLVSTASASAPQSITEVKQTGSTVALRPVMPDRVSVNWSTYPTDGQVKRINSGRHRIERTGYWQGSQLILRETGPGNAPWRRSTEQRTLSLAGEGRRMTITVHNLSDRKSTHDYAMVFERVRP